jgi:uncharacterized protein (DUF111 family)
MKIAYFDLISGASGDMILGALIDAGLSKLDLKTYLTSLRIDDSDIRAKEVNKNGYRSTKVDVLVSDKVPERKLPDILKIINQSSLPDHIQKKSIAIFNRLGTVEANIHGVSIEQVHLHELGGVDTIVDVVGSLVGIELLNIEKVIV